MAKPNYQFEKRQRDLAKKRKQEEKNQRRLKRISEAETSTDPETDVPPAEPDTSE